MHVRRLGSALGIAAAAAAALGGAVAGPADAATAAATSGATVALKVSGSKAPYFVLHERPGHSVTARVTVLDVGRGAGWVTLYPTDAVTGATTGAVYQSQTAARPGVGGWIRLSRRRVHLTPGQSATVALRMRVPRHTAPGVHLGGIVAEPDAPQAVLHRRRGQAAFGIKVREQSVIAVQVDLPGRRLQRLGITGVATGSQAGAQTVLLGLRSTGDALTHGRGTLLICDAAGHTRVRRSFTLSTFVPGTGIRFPVALTGPALGTGRYSARISVAWPTGHQTRTFGFTVSRRALTQVYGSRTASVQAGGSGTDLTPWLITGGLAALLMLGGGVALGARLGRRRPATP